MKKTFLLFALLASTGQLQSQIAYPFLDTQTKDEIVAYWYNVPRDSLRIKAIGQTLQFQSTLEIYGNAPSDSFLVSAQVRMPDGTTGFTRAFVVSKQPTDRSYQIQRRGKYFRLITTTHYASAPPSTIAVKIQADGKIWTKESIFRYHTLSGHITDFAGKPFRAAVIVRPDDFDSGNGVWTDESGNYSILLPERVYSNVFVDDESYGIETAEAWGWHVIHDKDQNLDFKVGTGEVYNLNVWPNNGGAKTYFVSFRPMSLYLYQNAGKKATVFVEGKEVELIDIAPELKTKDITVRFNGKGANIVSLQKYYEWTSGKVITAYLLQVSREGLENTGKQTVTVEYQSEGEIQGKRLVHSSLGMFQFYPNFTGLSFY